MINQVFADGIVPASQEGDFDLGADAVGGTDEHRLLPAGQRVAGAERADVGQDTAGERIARQFADRGNRPIRFIDVDAGILVAN